MSAQKWADIMDDEDNVPVRPGILVSRRQSIRPRRSFSDNGPPAGKQPVSTRETNESSETRVSDPQSVHEPTSD